MEGKKWSAHFELTLRIVCSVLIKVEFLTFRGWE